MTQAFQSIAELFLHRVSTSAEAEAFQFPSTNGWLSLSWREVGERVRGIACGLRALGLEDEQRCALLASTRIEWILADFGILCAGGATTTIYPSNTPDECSFIINDSATVFVFAENDAQVKKLAEKRAELAGVKHVITFDGKPSDDGWVLTLDQLLERGRAEDAAHPGRFEQVARRVSRDALATLVYTSGTTGQPKGVELTHDCWVYTAEAIEKLRLLAPDDRQYLWLPLAHVFGKVLETAQLQLGFVTAVDGRIDKLVENLAVVRPTFVAAVPRIFEKVHNKIIGSAREGGAVKLALFRWALSVGSRMSRLRQEGSSPSLLLAAEYAIARRLVLSKIASRFGGRLRFFVSGSAPLSRDIAEFFHSAGLLICEGYGLTESSAASFVNRPDRYRLGTVGLPLPGTEVKIAASDGEILLRGRGIMRGYRNQPEATREALDGEGWLHTGDIGELDGDGFLRITDRKKDLIKTSGGKYVAPQALEGKLKAICPYASQVVVHGNNRNFCSALIALDEEAARKWAAANGVGELAGAALAESPRMVALIQGYVDELNAGLASYSRVKKFAILPRDLTQEAGELTPSLKVKRKVVEQKYKAILDGFYAGAIAEG